jgi:hypothetical protein
MKCLRIDEAYRSKAKGLLALLRVSKNDRTSLSVNSKPAELCNEIVYVCALHPGFRDRAFKMRDREIQATDQLDRNAI